MILLFWNLKKKYLFIVKNIVYIISKENHYEVASVQILILLVNDNSHNCKGGRKYEKGINSINASSFTGWMFKRIGNT